jgi:hypothetical protein
LQIQRRHLGDGDELPTQRESSSLAGSRGGDGLAGVGHLPRPAASWPDALAGAVVPWPGSEEEAAAVGPRSSAGWRWGQVQAQGGAAGGALAGCARKERQRPGRGQAQDVVAP